MEESQTAVAVTTGTNDGKLVETVSVEEIISAHKEVVDLTWRLMDTGNKFIEKAAEVGRLLIAKKADVGHGNWLPWLAENVKHFSYETANHYMKAARYLERVPIFPESQPITMRYIHNLRQAIGLLEDKPKSDKENADKPAFVIRCVFNTEPDKLDEVQRRTAFDQAKPMLSVFEAFGFIEIKV